MNKYRENDSWLIFSIYILSIICQNYATAGNIMNQTYIGYPQVNHTIMEDEH